MKKRGKSWKLLIKAMILVAVAVTIFDTVAGVQRQYYWEKSYQQVKEAKEAGYDVEYRVCTREDDVILNGERYIHFHAFRPAVVDGNYSQHILAKYGESYIDKAPGQEEGLVVYARNIPYYGEQRGKDYTLVSIYSVCRDHNSEKESKWLFWAVIVTATGICLEIAFVLSFICYSMIRIKKYVSVQKES